MDILQEIMKMTTIDIEALIDRLKTELDVKNKNKDKIHYVIFDVFNIILEITHQQKVIKEMYSIAHSMIVDYWNLLGYDKKIKESNLSNNKNDNDNLPIKSIAIGDTTTTFEDTSSKVKMNGVYYETVPIDMAKDIITEKYQKRLYGWRKMRW